MNSFNLRSIVFVLLLLTFSFSSFSQGLFREGFYVNQKGDTISGAVKILGKDQDPKFQFKRTADAEEITISPDDNDAVVIKSYKFFRSITINKGRKFAEALVEGAASLYSWSNQFYLLKEGTIIPLEIEKIEVAGNGSPSVQNKKTYIGTLKAAMADCPLVWPKIDKVRLVESSLTSMVEDYNVCRNESAFVFKKDIPSLKVSINPLIAWSFSRINTKGDQSATGDLSFLRGAELTNMAVSPGIGFQFTNPRKQDRFSFYAEIRFLKNSFYDRYVYSQTTYDDNEVILNTSQLFVPIQGRYNFPLSTKSGVYLKGGIITTFLLNGEMTINRRVSAAPPNSPPSVTLNDFSFYSVQMWFSGGAGFQFGLTEKNNAWLEVRYESPGPLVNSQRLGMPLNVLSLITAISF